jgi:hypothetical protein
MMQGQARSSGASWASTRTVRDLIVGSDIVLDDRGTHPLRGVEGTWQLFAVVGP